MLYREDFEKLKIEKELLYKTFGEVYCPYFKEKVIFSLSGYEHLKFKKPRVARLEQDQFMRFKLLHLAPLVLSQSNTVQGIRLTKSFEETKINNRRESVLKEVTYYEFIAVIGNDRVKVVIKQVENGEKFFWSIIPLWQIDRVSKKRILYAGKIEE